MKIKNLLLWLVALLSLNSCQEEGQDAVFEGVPLNDLATISGSEGGHYYVDLGLPSGLKWATANMGASNASYPGSDFAWGELAKKEVYNWNSYKLCNKTKESLTKYNATDKKLTLLAEDDAAASSWGKGWRMPTKEEVQELLDGCSWSHGNVDFIDGVVAVGTSKTNGNKIVLINFWTSSVSPNAKENAFYFSNGLTYDLSLDSRANGKKIRPVFK